MTRFPNALTRNDKDILWQRSLVGCRPWGREESDTTEQLHFHFSLSCIGEGNGNPLQCSRLENPRDGGAWWATVYGVAQSWTRLSSSSMSTGMVKSIKITEKKVYKWTFIYMDSCNANHWGKTRHLLNKAVKFCIPLERNLIFDPYRTYKNQLQSMI